MGSSFTSHRPFASTTVDWVLPEKVTAILVEEEEEEHTLTHHKTEVPIPVKVGQALLSLKSWASSREGRDEYGKL